MSQVQSTFTNNGAGSVWPSTSDGLTGAPTPTSQPLSAPSTVPDITAGNPSTSVWSSLGGGDNRNLWSNAPSDSASVFGWPGNSLAESIKNAPAAAAAAASGGEHAPSDPSPPATTSLDGSAPPSVWSSTAPTPVPDGAPTPGPDGDNPSSILPWTTGFGLGALGPPATTDSEGDASRGAGSVWSVPRRDPWSSGTAPNTSTTSTKTSGSSSWPDTSPPDSAGPGRTDSWAPGGSGSGDNSGQNTPFGWADGQQQAPWNQDDNESTKGESFAKVASKGVAITNSANLPPNKSREEVERERAIQDIINSNEGWGTRVIRQDTPWNVEDSPQTKRRKEMLKKAESTMVWPQNDNKMGTQIWADTGDGVNKPQTPGPVANAATPAWNQMRPPSSLGQAAGWQRPAGAGANTWDMRGGSVSSYDAVVDPQPAGVPPAFSRSISWHPGASEVQVADKPAWEDDRKIGTWMSAGGGARPVTAQPTEQQPWTGAAAVRRDDRLWDSSESMQWNPSGRKEPNYAQNDNDMGHWTGDGSGAPSDFRPDNGTRHWMRPGAAPTPTPMNRQVSGSAYMGGNNQMRSKMTQQLVDMGFKKEEALDSLITNNMDFERTLNDLKSAGPLRGLGINTSVAPPMSKPGLPGMPGGMPPPQALLQKTGGRPPPHMQPGSVQQHQMIQQQQILAQLKKAVDIGLIGPQVLRQTISAALISSVTQLLQIWQNLQHTQATLQMLQTNLKTPMNSSQRQALVSQIQETQIRNQTLTNQYHQLTQLINGRSTGAASMPSIPGLGSPNLPNSMEMPQQQWQQQFQDLSISGGNKMQSKLNDWKRKDDMSGVGSVPAGVAEFVPGKPWQGLDMQRSADDDENLTPALAQQARDPMNPASPGWPGMGGQQFMPGQQRAMRSVDTSYPPPVGYLGGDNF